MRHRPIGLIIALLTAILAAPGLCGAATIAGAWSSASRVSAAQASQILLRQAEGEPVSALELFEAEKYLRSDGGVSAGSLVLSDMLTRLLARRARRAGAELRIRTLPPVLHWLETTNQEQDRLRLRGESLQVAEHARGRGAARAARGVGEDTAALSRRVPPDDPRFRGALRRTRFAVAPCHRAYRMAARRRGRARSIRSCTGLRPFARRNGGARTTADVVVPAHGG